jgi:hypothetical protein
MLGIGGSGRHSFHSVAGLQATSDRSSRMQWSEEDGLFTKCSFMLITSDFRFRLSAPFSGQAHHATRQALSEQLALTPLRPPRSRAVFYCCCALRLSNLSYSYIQLKHVIWLNSDNLFNCACCTRIRRGEVGAILWTAVFVREICTAMICGHQHKPILLRALRTFRAQRMQDLSHATVRLSDGRAILWNGRAIVVLMAMMIRQI